MDRRSQTETHLSRSGCELGVAHTLTEIDLHTGARTNAQTQSGKRAATGTDGIPTGSMRSESAKPNAGRVGGAARPRGPARIDIAGGAHTATGAVALRLRRAQGRARRAQAGRVGSRCTALPCRRVPATAPAALDAHGTAPGPCRSALALRGSTDRILGTMCGCRGL
jgi:hypothetical protein